MESETPLPALLRHAERAAAAPYIDYPPTPPWYPPAVGAWAAAMVLSVAALADHRALGAVGLVVLLAAEGAFFAWYRRYRQTMPSLQGGPPEIRAAFRRYAVGAVVTVAVCAAAYVVTGPVGGALVTFALVTAGLALYERHYAAAAAAARHRLGLPR